MAFGDNLLEVSYSSNQDSQSGIGGTEAVIWASTAPLDDSIDEIRELSTTDFSTVRSAEAPGTSGGGLDIGGDATTIWFADWVTAIAYKLSVTDFSVIRSTSVGISYTGIGGNAGVIWACDNGTNKIAELSTTDFSIVRSVDLPLTLGEGVGGDSTTIWLIDFVSGGVGESGHLYDISITDFSVKQTKILNASHAGVDLGGVGGDANAIWFCDYDDFIYVRYATGTEGNGEVKEPSSFDLIVPPGEFEIRRELED